MTCKVLWLGLELTEDDQVISLNEFDQVIQGNFDLLLLQQDIKVCELVISESLLKEQSSSLSIDVISHAKVIKFTFLKSFKDFSQTKNRSKVILKLIMDFKHWDFIKKIRNLTEDDLYQLLDQIEKKSAVEYIQRFREIMSKSFQINEIEAPSTSSVVDLEFCGPDYFRYEQLAKQNILSLRKAGFVLVAGGLGERLGSSEIKISLPTESLTGRSFLDLFIRHLMSFSDPPPPLFIMTSEDTHIKTLDLLDSLGFVEGTVMRNSITIAKQDTVVCFENREGILSLKNNNSELLLKPHGHGDVHLLLQNRCLSNWNSKEQLEHIVFFQDTNPQCFHILPILLGCLHENPTINCVIAAVPRIPKSATGCLARNSSSKTLENIEYNLMNQIPDLNDDQFILGNTNQYAIRLNRYEKMEKFMPEFCNPKYLPNDSNSFSSPTRLECLMQDILKFFNEEEVKVVLFEDFQENHSKTHVLYCPAKNSLKVAQRCWEMGTTDGSPASSEACVYLGNSGMLTSIGCKIQLDKNESVFFGDGKMNITPLSPSIVIDPFCLPYWSDHSIMFVSPEKVFIGKDSSLEFRGPGKIIVKKLHLEGSLFVWSKNPKSVIVLEDLTLKNSGRIVTSVTGEARIHVNHSKNCYVIQSDEDFPKLISFHCIE